MARDNTFLQSDTTAPSTTLNVYGHVVAGAQERAIGAISTALAAAQARLTAGENAA